MSKNLPKNTQAKLICIDFVCYRGKSQLHSTLTSSFVYLSLYSLLIAGSNLVCGSHTWICTKPIFTQRLPRQAVSGNSLSPSPKNCCKQVSRRNRNSLGSNSWSVMFRSVLRRYSYATGSLRQSFSQHSKNSSWRSTGTRSTSAESCLPRIIPCSLVSVYLEAKEWKKVTHGKQTSVTCLI